MDPDADSFFISGQKHVQNKEFMKAIGDFTMAISLRPDYGNAYLERAKAKMEFAEKMGFANKEYCFDLVQALNLGVDEAASLLEGTCDGECFNIQKALIEPEIVFCADFSSKIMSSLPKGTEQLTNLVKLNLFNNRLTEFPAVLTNLKSLLLLDLSSNNVSDLGNGISQLSHLEELNLNKNALSIIPQNIGGLVRLKRLFLRSNQLTEISSNISKCQELEQLDLSLNKLTTLPLEISQLKKLKVLNLVGNQFDKKSQKAIKNSLPNTQIYF